jgi:rRNA processing protein Krr1/Pno1
MGMNAPDAAMTIHVTDKTLSALGQGIKLGEIRAAVDELQNLCHVKIAAAETFATTCKAVAERSGINPSVLATFINAIAKDKLRENQKKAEQLSLLFEEIEA